MTKPAKTPIRKIQDAIAERYEHDLGPDRHEILSGPYGEALGIAVHQGEVVLFNCHDAADSVGQVNLDTERALRAAMAAITEALAPAPQDTP